MAAVNVSEGKPMVSLRGRVPSFALTSERLYCAGCVTTHHPAEGG
ncbi:MAG: hypothetical protein JWO70_1935 [Betaproteobacteria bacterium]|nr:hypothetical protein [Betaproteobacteria bacterium]